MKKFDSHHQKNFGKNRTPTNYQNTNGNQSYLIIYWGNRLDFLRFRKPSCNNRLSAIRASSSHTQLDKNRSFIFQTPYTQQHFFIWSNFSLRLMFSDLSRNIDHFNTTHFTFTTVRQIIDRYSTKSARNTLNMLIKLSLNTLQVIGDW